MIKPLQAAIVPRTARKLADASAADVSRQSKVKPIFRALVFRGHEIIRKRWVFGVPISGVVLKVRAAQSTASP
jgi:hypothetical protein